MGKRGPRPKPTALKKVQGTYRPDREAARAARPAVAAPSCPAHLSAEAKREWKRIVPELERLGLVAEIDRAALAGYCESWSTWVACEKEVRKKGRTFTTPNGYVQQRPEVAIGKAALKTMKAFLTEFGMTPASRTKISTAEKDDGDGNETDEQAAKRFFGPRAVA